MPKVVAVSWLITLAHAAMTVPSTTFGSEFLEPLQPQIASAITAADELPAERQRLLRSAAEAIGQQLRENEQAPLVFICTSNSRRSQLAQVWAKVAAAHCGLDRIETYSGGTEATACDRRTVRALRRAGFSVVAATSGDNPRYLVQFAESEPPIELFSKRFADGENPQRGFVALMCCADADQACPVVPGATARVRLAYDDPKRADGTAGEDAAYDGRSRQIAAEMFYLIGEVAKRQ